MALAWTTLQTTTPTKEETTKMEDDTNIYNELAEIDMLRDRVKANQDQVLDIYDPENDKMAKLLVEMNDLLAEVEQVENEMQELMKQL